MRSSSYTIPPYHQTATDYGTIFEHHQYNACLADDAGFEDAESISKCKQGSYSNLVVVAVFNNDGIISIPCNPKYANISMIPSGMYKLHFLSIRNHWLPNRPAIFFFSVL